MISFVLNVFWWLFCIIKCEVKSVNYYQYLGTFFVKVWVTIDKVTLYCLANYFSNTTMLCPLFWCLLSNSKNVQIGKWFAYKYQLYLRQFFLQNLFGLPPTPWAPQLNVSIYRVTLTCLVIILEINNASSLCARCIIITDEKKRRDKT